MPDTTTASNDIARVLLADDHTMLREGLRRSLAAEGYEIVGEAADGREAVELTQSLDPEVVLMDVTMPVLDGIEATRQIRKLYPRTRVVMLTMHVDAHLIRRAADAGASGYLVKDCTTDDIKTAISLAKGGTVSFPEGGWSSTPASGQDQAGLTKREIQILQLIAEGRSTTEVASSLYLSIKTVKNHLASTYSKLDSHDRTAAVIKAVRLGIVSLPGN